MLTGKTNIRSNLTKTLLIILGIVIALLMSFNSGLIAQKSSLQDGDFQNPFAKEEVEVPASTSAGQIGTQILKVTVAKIGSL